MLSISLPYYYYKANIFPNIIFLVPFTLFQIYNITSYDHGHMPLYYPRKEKNPKEKKY